jgi:hypothetical protein
VLSHCFPKQLFSALQDFGGRRQTVRQAQLIGTVRADAKERAYMIAQWPIAHAALRTAIQQCGEVFGARPANACADTVSEGQKAKGSGYAIGDNLRRARSEQHRLGTHFMANAIDGSGKALQAPAYVGSHAKVRSKAERSCWGVW